jgi:hypothetical protein
MTNREKFLKLVSNEETNTIERAKQRIAKCQEPGPIKQLIEKMKNDPWHKKLRRWWKFQRWILICKILFIYENNIFRKK